MLSTPRTVRIADWQIAAWLCVALAALAGCGPGPQPTSVSPQAVDNAAQSLFEGSPALAKVFQEQNARPQMKFKFEVIVDQSASMQGYVDYPRSWDKSGSSVVHGNQTKGTNAPPSNFANLLRRLGHESELSGYFGFGSDAHGVQTITEYGHSPPLEPKLYTRYNNDFADLLSELGKRPPTEDDVPIERIIITDGVQSHRDRGAGSELAQTVAQLRGWIERGGAVDVRLLTAPYAGTYYSEELRARNLPYSYAGQAERRPFLVISLLSKAEDLPVWKAFWKRHVFSDLEPTTELSYPAETASTSKLTIEPEPKIPNEVTTNVRYRNVWDLSKIVTLDGYNDLWRANVRKIRTKAEASPLTYPACFLLKGMTSSNDSEADLRAMNPVLEVWHPGAATAAPKTKPVPAALPTTGGTPDPPAQTPVGWQKAASIDLRDFGNGKVAIAKLDSATGFRFCATLDVPAKKEIRAVVLTAKPQATMPPAPDWKQYSVLDDSLPTNLDRIYNLQPLVEQLSSGQLTAPAPIGACVFTYR